MKKLKVLIADDSVVYRSQIRAALQSLPNVEVVAAASNGRLALERLVQTPVDLLVLDLEMPEMDGLETLKEMAKHKIKCKVLMFSSLSKRGAEITMEALALGASDFITKPAAGNEAGSQPAEKIRELLEPKIKMLFPECSEQYVPRPSVEKSFPKIIWELFKPKIVVIGSSTGGPTVLEKIFSELSTPFNCPIVITQHMPPIFTTTLAERLSKLSGIPGGEAQHGEALRNNRFYIAPGNYHLSLEGDSALTRLMLDQGPHVHSVRPAVDPLFSSAASIFKNRCLGIVLTGMGFDGKSGAESIKDHGGAVIIQEEKSCVVFGMPGAVYHAGAYDLTATPDEIIKILNDKVRS